MGRGYFRKCFFDLCADKVQWPIHGQKSISLVDSQDGVDLGEEILFGRGEAKKLGHPGIQVLLVPKHPFIDHGLPSDLLIAGPLHYFREVIAKVVPDMSCWSMRSHEPVKETARGRISCHLYH